MSALVADPEHEGVRLLARDASGRGAGFATLYWSWSTTSTCRIGVMNDLGAVDCLLVTLLGRWCDQNALAMSMWAWLVGP
jgi:hypothetical protein